MQIKFDISRSSHTRVTRNGGDSRSSRRNNFFKNEDYQKDEIKYVSSKNPCQICGKPDWCAYTVNVSREPVLALCHRDSYGSIKQAQDGSYIHVLNNQFGKPREQKSTPKQTSVKPSNSKAEVTRCDAVYRKLLERLLLNENHAENLLNRGLGDDTIAQNLYASVPAKSKGDEIAQELSEEMDLTGVPGFYKVNGVWKLNTYHKGFYVPFHNHKGLIMGMQIRLDIPVDKRKYVWLSTPDKDSGASSGSPLHFVNVDVIESTKTIYVTEGALKADVIGELKKVGVVAIAGVKALKADILADILKTLFPDLQRVFIAFDMDSLTNGKVEKALSEMENEFKKWDGLEIKTLSWDINDGKGFDDYLLQLKENENE